MIFYLRTVFSAFPGCSAQLANTRRKAAGAACSAAAQRLWEHCGRVSGGLKKLILCILLFFFVLVLFFFLFVFLESAKSWPLTQKSRLSP